eukprot:SAG31_NODE_22410_length_526_cov_0.953162_1_plen_129_part_01
MRGREGRLRAARTRRRRDDEERREAPLRVRQWPTADGAVPFENESSGGTAPPTQRRQEAAAPAQRRRHSLGPRSGPVYESSLPEPVLSDGAAATIVERTHAALEAKVAQKTATWRMPGARLAGKGLLSR